MLLMVGCGRKLTSLAKPLLLKPPSQGHWSQLDDPSFCKPENLPKNISILIGETSEIDLQPSKQRKKHKNAEKQLSVGENPDTLVKIPTTKAFQHHTDTASVRLHHPESLWIHGNHVKAFQIDG